MCGIFIFFWQVLWMRQRDLHILTSALHTYTNDWRISAVHATVREPRGPSPPPAAADDNNNNNSKNSFVSDDSQQHPAASAGSSIKAGQKNAVVDDVWDEEEGVWSEWTLVLNILIIEIAQSNCSVYFIIFIKNDLCNI